MLRRINPFWAGAGLLLFIFGANELAAFLLVRVPRFLGGSYAAFSGLSTMVVGLLVGTLLGLRPPPEPPAVQPGDED